MPAWAAGMPSPLTPLPEGEGKKIEYLSQAERAEVENDVLDVLDREIRSARFVKKAVNRRFMFSRHDRGGEISVIVDVELSFLGRVLVRLGISL